MCQIMKKFIWFSDETYSGLSPSEIIWIEGSTATTNTLQTPMF